MASDSCFTFSYALVVSNIASFLKVSIRASPVISRTWFKLAICVLSVANSTFLSTPGLVANASDCFWLSFRAFCNCSNAVIGSFSVDSALRVSAKELYAFLNKSVAADVSFRASV